MLRFYLQSPFCVFFFVCFSFPLQKVKKNKIKEKTKPQLVSVSVKDRLDLSTEQEEK